MTFLRAALLGLGLAAAGACTSLPPAPRPSPRVVIDAHVREIHAVAFSPDGSLFASAGGGANPAVDEITLWTTATGERRMTFADYKGVASSLAFSPDGKLLAAGATDGRITLLEMDSGTERSSFAGTAGAVARLAFTFDGKVLVSVVHLEGDEETVEVSRWDVDRSAQRASFRPGASSPFALSPDGMTLAWIVQGRPSGVWTANLETQDRRLIANLGIVRGDTLVFSPDGRQLAAVHHAGWSPIPNHCPYIYVFDAHTGRILLRSPRPFDARRGLAISHDGRLLARGVDGGFQLWDLKAAEESANVSGPASKTEGADLLVFSPDDRTLVSTDRRGILLLWDVPKLIVPSAGAAP
jgi:WD40 repeat protein